MKQGYKPELVVVIVRRRGNTRLFASSTWPPQRIVVWLSRKWRAYSGKSSAWHGLWFKSGEGAADEPIWVFVGFPESNARYNCPRSFWRLSKLGSVTPTRYHVLVNSSTLSPEYIQRLTFALTHMYFNWPGESHTRVLIWNWPNTCHQERSPCLHQCNTHRSARTSRRNRCTRLRIATWRRIFFSSDTL